MGFVNKLFVGDDASEKREKERKNRFEGAIYKKFTFGFSASSPYPPRLSRLIFMPVYKKS